MTIIGSVARNRNSWLCCLMSIRSIVSRVIGTHKGGELRAPTEKDQRSRLAPPEPIIMRRTTEGREAGLL